MKRVSVDEHVPGETTYFGQCLHAWVVAQPGFEFAEICADCGAGCTRGERKKIVAFDAKLPLEPRRPRR